MKTAVLHTRMSPTLKEQAESILEKAGLSASEAVRIFFAQVVIHRGIPFNVSAPNEETADTLRKSDKDVGVKSFKTPNDAFAQWKKL